MNDIFPEQLKFWDPGNILEQPDEVPANHQTFHELGWDMGRGARKEKENMDCLPARWKAKGQQDRALEETL